MDDANVNIVQVISDSGVDLKQHGDLYKAICPFHTTAEGTPEKTPSFTVYPTTNSFYCFGCSCGGDAITFIINRNSCDYKSALDYLGIKGSIFSPTHLKNKLQVTIQEPDEFTGLWLFINKLVYTKKLSLSPLSGQLDRLLYLDDASCIYSLREIKNSLLKNNP